MYPGFHPCALVKHFLHFIRTVNKNKVHIFDCFLSMGFSLQEAMQLPYDMFERGSRAISTAFQRYKLTAVPWQAS